jgi:sortase (surface protein transpeptidase)
MTTTPTTDVPVHSEVEGAGQSARRFRRKKNRDEASADEVTQSGTPAPLSPRLQFIRAALIMVVVLCVTLLAQISFIGAFQHNAAQERLFDEFRAELANGTAPVGAVDGNNRELPIGTPVAFLEIPEIGVSEVVVEGTTSAALFSGPGHRRDTVLPGQLGASVIMGRHSAFGGPFGDISELEEGDTIEVTTGQGEFEYEVLGVRYEGDPVPPPPEAGVGRLILITAAGRSYMPDGVVRVDAELSEAVVGPGRVYTADTLPASEQPMGIDNSTLWSLVLWIQALIAVSIGAVWAWHRWGKAQAWIVFVPAVLFVGLGTAAQVARLLPNLL